MAAGVASRTPMRRTRIRGPTRMGTQNCTALPPGDAAARHCLLKCARSACREERIRFVRGAVSDAAQSDRRPGVSRPPMWATWRRRISVGRAAAAWSMGGHGIVRQASIDGVAHVVVTEDPYADRPLLSIPPLTDGSGHPCGRKVAVLSG